MFDAALHTARTWTGAMFLQAAAQFVRMTPDRGQWNEEHLADNPPRLVRYRRLRALARAFDVQPGFEAVLDGSFLTHRSFESLARVNAAILQDVSENHPGLLDRGELRFHPLQPTSSARMAYSTFARHLVRAYSLMDSNSGFLEVSGAIAYATDKTGSVNREVEKMLGPIEVLVSLFISADAMPRDVDELRAFGWPEDDLQAVDFENI